MADEKDPFSDADIADSADADGIAMVPTVFVGDAETRDRYGAESPGVRAEHDPDDVP